MENDRNKNRRGEKYGRCLSIMYYFFYAWNANAFAAIDSTWVENVPWLSCLLIRLSEYIFFSFHMHTIAPFIFWTGRIQWWKKPTQFSLISTGGSMFHRFFFLFISHAFDGDATQLHFLFFLFPFFGYLTQYFFFSRFFSMKLLDKKCFFCFSSAPVIKDVVNKETLCLLLFDF